MTTAERLLIVFFLVVGGLLLLSNRSPGGDVPLDGPDLGLVAVFSTGAGVTIDEARQRAGDAAAFFDALAVLIEHDGGQAVDARKLRSSADVEDFRKHARAIYFGGWKFGDHFPKFGEVVDRVLTPITGDSGGAPLDGPGSPTLRAKWIGGLRQLAAACEVARLKI
jgi:hypothetical protein